MLLGELALDGRVRPVKGVLPAVLTAKREGWPAVVVPVDNLRRGQPGRRHRGVGRGDVGSAAGLARGKGATGRQDRRAAVCAGTVGRSRRRRRAVPCPLRRRGGRRRCPPPDADRAAGCRQNDAGTTASGSAAGVVAQRVAGGHRDPFGGRPAVGQHAADHPAAVRGAAPHVERGGAGRRGDGDGAAGCGQPRAPRRAVSRRVRRDRGQRAGSVANTVGGRRDSAGAPRRRGPLSGAVSAGAGGQPVSVCAGRSARLHLRVGRQAAVSGQAVGPAAGPGRPARADAPRAGRRVFGAGRRVDRSRARTGAAAREAAAKRWQPHGIRTNAEVSGVLLRRRFRPERGGDGTAADRARPRPAQHPGGRQDIAGRLDACPTWPAGRRRGWTRSPPR